MVAAETLAAPPAVGAAEPAAAIALQGLTARYPGARRPALRGVDLRAGVGILVLLGPTGSGKSTLLRVLAGQLPPEAGMALVGGRNAGRDPLAVRSRIGYAPQEVGLPHELTLREYLLELAALDGIPPAHRGERVAEAAAAVHLQGALHRRLSRLSGGMRRRALLAQALLRRPPVLLVDEPTAGLDPAERIAVQNLLRERAVRTCVVVATHFLADAAALPGQVAILHAGRLLRHAETGDLPASAAGEVWAIPGLGAGDLPGCVALPTSAGGTTRVVGTPPEGSGARALAPTLEDAYFLALLRAALPPRGMARRGGRGAP